MNNTEHDKSYSGSNVYRFELGDVIRVITGGKGCLIANGIVGMVVDKSHIDYHMYGGEYRNLHAKMYVAGLTNLKLYGKITRFYGLCRGYEVELLTNINSSEFENLVKEMFLKKEVDREFIEQFMDKDFFEKYKTDTTLSSLGF